MFFGYGFRGYLPGGVAASGISTNSRICGAWQPHVGLCPIFLVISIIIVDQHKATGARKVSKQTTTAVASGCLFGGSARALEGDRISPLDINGQAL